MLPVVEVKRADNFALVVQKLYKSLQDEEKVDEDLIRQGLKKDPRMLEVLNRRSNELEPASGDFTILAKTILMLASLDASFYTFFESPFCEILLGSLKGLDEKLLLPRVCSLQLFFENLPKLRADAKDFQSLLTHMSSVDNINRQVTLLACVLYQRADQAGCLKALVELKSAQMAETFAASLIRVFNKLDDSASVMHLLCDMLKDPSTRVFFFQNDIKCLVDAIIRKLDKSDRSPEHIANIEFLLTLVHTALSCLETSRYKEDEIAEVLDTLLEWAAKEKNDKITRCVLAGLDKLFGQELKVD